MIVKTVEDCKVRINRADGINHGSDMSDTVNGFFNAYDIGVINYYFFNEFRIKILSGKSREVI